MRPFLNATKNATKVRDWNFGHRQCVSRTDVSKLLVVATGQGAHLKEAM